MRVLMFGMFDRTYPRNRVVLEAMRRRGIRVQVCHRPLWELQRDKVRGYAGLWNRCKLALGMVWAWLALLARWLAGRWKADVVWVGFPGHADMPLAWLVGKVTGRPVVFDAFISWYDSAVRDRGLFPKTSFTARLLRWCDYISCHLADRVIVDTPEHAAFFRQMFRLPAEKVTWLPVGADERVFAPGEPAAGEAAAKATTGAEPFRVLQYAEYTPLHGGEHVLDAAMALQARGVPVVFELIGDGGPFFEKLQALAAERGQTNVEFRDYVPERELVARVRAADVCLGVFGDGAKAQRVIPNKVWQCLAMRKPVITAETPAVQRWFEHGRDLWLCPAADGEALAEAIERLRGDAELRERLAATGHDRFQRTCSIDAIGDRIYRELRAALVGKGLERLVPVDAAVSPADG